MAISRSLVLVTCALLSAPTLAGAQQVLPNGAQQAPPARDARTSPSKCRRSRRPAARRLAPACRCAGRSWRGSASSSKRSPGIRRPGRSRGPSRTTASTGTSTSSSICRRSGASVRSCWAAAAWSATPTSRSPIRTPEGVQHELRRQRRRRRARADRRSLRHPHGGTLDGWLDGWLARGGSGCSTAPRLASGTLTRATSSAAPVTAVDRSGRPPSPALVATATDPVDRRFERDVRRDPDQVTAGGSVVGA